MKPFFKEIDEIQFIGMHINHSMVDNKTVELWKSFMPRKHEIVNVKNNWHYAIQQYDQVEKMKNFTGNTIFKTWAAVEVNSSELIPANMELLMIPSGLYAVFAHRGNAEMFAKSMGFIMNNWLPKSEYELDKRPHFQIMKENYLGENDINSEEEIWIPIK